jgi:hypothetical protein
MTSVSVKDIRTIVFRTTTSVSGVDSSSSLCISPNPASEYLNINHQFDAETEIVIFNTTGHQVLKSMISNYSNRIYVKNLIPGIYILKFENQFIKFTKK